MHSAAAVVRAVCLDREQLQLSVPALQMSILSTFKARSWHCIELQPCEVTAAGRAVSSIRMSVSVWVITLTTLFLLCGTAGSVPPPAPGERPGVALEQGLCLAPFLTAALEGLHPSAFMQSFWNLGSETCRVCVPVQFPAKSCCAGSESKQPGSSPSAALLKQHIFESHSMQRGEFHRAARSSLFPGISITKSTSSLPL